MWCWSDNTTKENGNNVCMYTYTVYTYASLINVTHIHTDLTDNNDMAYLRSHKEAKNTHM